MAALFAAPEPAGEVIVLDRAMVETILNELEAADPLRSLVVNLRAALAAPKVELWALRSIGPNEVFPAIDRQHAERMVADLIAAGEQIKQQMIDDGESVEHWTGWEAEIIPSPWEPAEHFEILAQGAMDEENRLRELAVKSGDDRSKLLASLTMLLGHLDANGVPPTFASQKAHDTINEVTAEERARKARLKALREGTLANPRPK